MNDGGNFDRREQNVVQYWSPNWSASACASATRPTSSSRPRAIRRTTAAASTYRGGPLYVFYAYEQHKDQVANHFATAAAAAGKKETGHAVGGTFAFGPVRFGVVGEKIKKSDRTDQKPWLANIAYTMGNNVFGWQYSQNKGGFAPGAAQLDCTVNVASWQYNFSKRTFVLAQYMNTKNDNSVSNCGAGNSALNSAPFLVTGGQDPKGFTLGVSHVF
jgi:predicted porin